MTMPLPTITTNSTSRARLIGQQINALHGLREARRWLEDCEPHGRDYPGKADWHAAQDAYINKLKIIDAMISEIEKYVEALDTKTAP